MCIVYHNVNKKLEVYINGIVQASNDVQTVNSPVFSSNSVLTLELSTSNSV